MVSRDFSFQKKSFFFNLTAFMNEKKPTAKKFLGLARFTTSVTFQRLSLSSFVPICLSLSATKIGIRTSLVNVVEIISERNYHLLCYMKG